MHDDRQKAIEMQNQKIKNNMSRIKNKIIVISGKGGVGKTSVSVNLAYALSKENNKVGILDADLHGPNIAKMLGVEQGFVDLDEHGIKPIEVNQNLKAISIAFLGHHPDNPIIWRGPMKTNVIGQFLSDVNWGKLDYLIIDSPPGTGDEPLSVCQMIPDLNGAIIVTTPQDVAILDSRKSIFFARQLKIPVIGIIENMSGFICPHCNKQINIFKKGGGEKAAKELNVPFLGAIPLVPEFVENGDKGEPFVNLKDSLKEVESFYNIIDNIKTKLKSLVKE